jgi:hypothetical protein
MAADTEMAPPVGPALAKVTILEVARHPWGWLMTSAKVNDRVYVGSREWRQQLNSTRTSFQLRMNVLLHSWSTLELFFGRCGSARTKICSFTPKNCSLKPWTEKAPTHLGPGQVGRADRK